MSEEKNLLEVSHLKQYFPVHQGFKTIPLKAVDDISFAIKPGETLGLVGESGCGKTTVGRTLLRLYQPTAGRIVFDGKVLFDSGEQYDENGKLIVDANGKPVLGKKVDVDMLPYRRQMQMVFQDPYSSLNPRMTVEDIIGEPLDVHKLYANKKERREKILNLMELVGLNAEHAMRYAHEFSGGQRQRIGIARALAVNPKFIVCDEPVSALDVSIQAQVVNMFEELQDKLGVAYLFIAHDLLVVHHISDRIAVMYLGKMMEIADADELNGNPMHPYTLSLLSAVPIPDPETARHSKRIVLEGDVPSPGRCRPDVRSAPDANTQQSSAQKRCRRFPTGAADTSLHAGISKVSTLPKRYVEHRSFYRRKILCSCCDSRIFLRKTRRIHYEEISSIITGCFYGTWSYGLWRII